MSPQAPYFAKPAPRAPISVSKLSKALEHRQAGRLAEAESLYRSILKCNPKYFDARTNLAYTLKLQGKLDGAVEEYKMCLVLNPHSAETYSSIGLILHTQRKLEEAKGYYTLALAIKPDYAEVYNNLGAIFQSQNRFEEAIANYRRALSIKPTFVDPQINIGHVFRIRGEFDEAIETFKRAHKLSPQSLAASKDISVLLRLQGKLEEAEAWFQNLAAANPDQPEVHFDRALLRLAAGNYVSGLPEYEWRPSRLENPFTCTQPQWYGEPLNGKRILLSAEQGLGDSLQALRYVPMVQAAGGTVILAVPPPLHRIATQLPGVELVTYGGTIPPFDLYCQLMSLPLAFGTTPETIPAQVPYLRAPDEAVQMAVDRPWATKGLRVGISWAGSPTHVFDKERSIPFRFLEPLLHQQGVHFYSLQMGTSVADLNTTQATVTDLSGAIKDMADTAALMSQLDLVITVDTSVAHLAGAFAIPVWVMMPPGIDWRWLLDREDSPWYPTMRLFRQPKLGDWVSTVQRVQISLAELASKRQCDI